MGASHSNPDWFIKRTVAEGGKYTSCNGWQTRVNGFKPILVTPTVYGTAWVIGPKVSLLGRSCRVVADTEVASGRHLLHVYGSFLITYADVPQGVDRPIICHCSTIARVVRYLDLGIIVGKTASLKIHQVSHMNPHGYSEPRFRIRGRLPTLDFVGADERGTPVFELRPKTSNSVFRGGYGVFGLVGNTMTTSRGTPLHDFVTKSESWILQ